MKRSNRLVLLIGVFLAVIAFVGVLVLSQPGGGGQPQEPTEATVVVARQDIPLGTVIEADMVENRTLPINAAEADAYNDTSQVLGQIARQEVVAGAQITTRTTSGGVSGRIIDLDVPAGQRAMAIQVDQVTGVGTLIKTGDYVDALVRLQIQPTTVDEDGNVVPIDEVENQLSSKVLLQGLQVIGVLLPPPPAAAQGAEGGATDQGTALTDQREIVIVSVTPAQAEVLKFVEDPDGRTVSLLLRSPTDFLDENGNPRLPESPCTTQPTPAPLPGDSPAPEPSPTYQGCVVTPGVVLRTLVDQYGVLVPSTAGVAPVVNTPVPSPTPEPEESPAP